jgi:hypothetical protein
MQQWADYLDTLASGKAVAGKFGKVAYSMRAVCRDYPPPVGPLQSCISVACIPDAAILPALCYTPM